MNFSLMSLFDPVSYGYPLSWVECLVVLLFVNSNFSSVSTGIYGFFKKIVFLISLTLSQGLKSPKVSSLFLTSLFFYIFLVNELGMLPFVFTSSSHLVFNFSFSIPFWMAGLFLLNFQSFLAHLLPQGSPMVLSPFLVCIELTSLLVRPISLGVRLMSNIMAGHMVLCLIQSLMGDLFFSSLTSIFLSSMFLLFELAVALVQAFVFVNLTYMYLKEAE